MSIKAQRRLIMSVVFVVVMGVVLFLESTVAKTATDNAEPSGTPNATSTPFVSAIDASSVAASGSAASGGAVSGSSVTFQIKKVSRKRYAKDRLRVYKEPLKKAKILRRYKKGTKLKVTGVVKDTKFVQIKYKGKYAYVAKNMLTKKKPWTGSRLTRSAGVNAGPSGKETYYNLPMGGVIRYMRARGNHDRYWVRNDGVKMLGKYVMVAANIHLRPYGSHVPTSLGMGVVVDTGTFARSNPRQLDIAVAW